MAISEVPTKLFSSKSKVDLVAVAHGDGIGPEIMTATLRVLQASGANVNFLPIELGAKVYERGLTSGITDEAWDTIRAARVVLKAPITTPQGGGVKSLNVTLRKTLGLFANVRPVPTYHPFVATAHPGMDVVIVRENEEDLYAGIEHRQTEDVVQCLKLMSRPGCERIARYAFAYAKQHGRRKVTCMTKDNIMKLTDGLFHRVFDEVGREFPEIEKEHMIIDIGAAKLAIDPTRFDVILAPNLYGDILSDIAAEVAGSVGLAASANVGPEVAMFEAVHGSAPDIAGLGVANPSGLLLASVLMLVHLGQADAANRIQNAWLSTIEEGIHPADIFQLGSSLVRAGTEAFADAVIARLGETPRYLKPSSFEATAPIRVETSPIREAEKVTVGVDVFVRWRGPVEELAARLQRADAEGMTLGMITNRGVKVWPNGLPETTTTDHWRCRFTSPVPVTGGDVVAVLSRVVGEGLDLVKTETLCNFDGLPGYSLGQGQ